MLRLTCIGRGWPSASFDHNAGTFERETRCLLAVWQCWTFADVSDNGVPAIDKLILESVLVRNLELATVGVRHHVVVIGVVSAACARCLLAERRLAAHCAGKITLADTLNHVALRRAWWLVLGRKQVDPRARLESATGQFNAIVELHCLAIHGFNYLIPKCLVTLDSCFDCWLVEKRLIFRFAS